MRSRRRSSDQNLDPLLDTMANVVGILVMLVAVTQLSVGDAVERIRERGSRESVDFESLEAAEAERERVENALVSASGQLSAMLPTEKRVGLLIEEATPLLEILEALPGRDSLRGLGAEALHEHVQRDAEQVARLRDSIKESRRKMLRLDEILTDLPEERRPKIARLPDPRPAPPGYRQAAFFCRYGRVKAIELQKMTALLHDGIRLALGDDFQPEMSDRPWLENFFRKTPMGLDGFYWSFRSQNTARFFADVTWNDASDGETAADLRLGDSSFAERLRGLAGQRRFIRFYVWSDSFEVYLEARYLAESAGLDVSWYAVDSNDEVGVDLRGHRQPAILID
jgi:hypothetical protein